ncbi:MAG: UDP-N-acetylmuramate:L-alanyl-gamma-D-glutamyl-meso-diaminopimelate ligase [Deltaproteobacteria bacterium]|jgi:UDP-N-acetylmuramate: L-alanyl-gamma-D-glutamyl-meso-diaminopimelate ligase|nr:UDP-N-acetylmuramate:L-alanyl-gamma-D-glutamyl-meso-diaminopimelate ligase [Deltaproteobacteria bacterium]
MSPGCQPLLDPSLNFFPVDPHHIHLMGVGGTGMAAMAGLLKKAGYTISGSDSQVYPPMSDYLAASGVQVQEGYRADNLHPRPDLVVVGNVIRRENPEALELARQAIPYVSFPQALAEKFLANKTALVVAGTHGKTTTSSILATMLAGAGLDPGFMIGGIVKAFQANFHLGKGAYFVVEGDEYDTAFFDKGPKFLHYQPQIAILTSVEFDHADIYADFAAVRASFARLVAIMPSDGVLVACYDDPVIRDLCQGAPCKVVSYGLDPAWDWSFQDMANSGGFTAFTLRRQGRAAGDFKSIMPGRHNVLNSLAVLAVLAEIGMTQEMMARQLAAFQGVCRRQEVRGVAAGVTVIDDFAHHPTAVHETLAALRGAYPGQRLVAVFEPRTNSSRRTIFQERYAQVFADAHEIVIKEPEPLMGVAPEDHFSAGRLAADLRARGQQAASFQDTDLILEHLLATLHSGDVIAVLSNGGFDNIHQRLLAALAVR